MECVQESGSPLFYWYFKKLLIKCASKSYKLTLNSLYWNDRRNPNFCLIILWKYFQFNFKKALLSLFIFFCLQRGRKTAKKNINLKCVFFVFFSKLNQGKWCFTEKEKNHNPMIAIRRNLNCLVTCWQV